MKLYTNVKSCQRCGSSRTGFYILKTKAGKVNDLTIQKSYLNRGMLVIPTDMMAYNNCFCVDCGIEWKEDLVTSLYSDSDVENEKKSRGIDESYIDSFGENAFRETEEFDEKLPTCKKKKKKHRLIKTIKTYFSDMFRV